MLDIKAGDRVLVESRWSRSIQTVKSVTPTGNIRLENGGYYNSDGTLKSSDPWNSSRITPLTEELEEKLKQEKFINETLGVLKDLKSITYEQAIEIRKIIDIG